MMLWLDDQVFCTYHESSMLQLQGVNSVNHLLSLGVSPCHVMQCRDARFLEVGFGLSKVMSPSWRWSISEASQEALGEDAILHRSSGRPGEDKKKVEKMLGELLSTQLMTWMDGRCWYVAVVFMVPPKRPFPSRRSCSRFYSRCLGEARWKTTHQQIIQINYNKKKHTLQPGEETYPSTRCQHTLQFSSS